MRGEQTFLCFLAMNFREMNLLRISKSYFEGKMLHGARES